MVSVSSPAKRPKRSSAASAAHELFTSEPALLDTIVSFVPVDSNPVSAEDDDDSVYVSVDTTLATITALCRAFPSLGKRLGPQNENFWRTMVLRRFDFQVDPEYEFNVQDNDERWIERGPDFCWDDDEPAVVPVHPIRAAINQWHIDNPDVDGDGPYMLNNNLAYWSAIGAYFRPAEFQFLGDIQSGHANVSVWPAHEDAFSLYRDLVLIEGRLSTFEDRLATWSDGAGTVYPCLLSRLQGEATVTDGGYELLKHCDFMPHYWDGHQHKNWSGFSVPLPADKPTDPKIDLDQIESELRSLEEQAIFPMTNDDWRSFERLRRMVHESFVDWRRLHVAESGEEYMSVEFYIGMSKASRRWIGFVGESTYCALTPAEAQGGDESGDEDEPASDSE